jgi:hypothetical protein
MRHSITFDSGRQAVCNSALPITHCLVGKRNDAFERPDEKFLAPGMTRNQMSDKEFTALRAYVFAKNKGKYVIQALAWTEGEDEAIKSRFADPEWEQESLKFIPVTTHA